MYQWKLIWGEADNEQSKSVNELKGIDKGIKSVEKRSFPNNAGLFIGAIENVFNKNIFNKR